MSARRITGSELATAIELTREGLVPAAFGDPQTIEEFNAMFPAWHCYEGFSQLIYARLLLSSPPIVVKAATVAGVLRAVRENIKQRRS